MLFEDDHPDVDDNIDKDDLLGMDARLEQFVLDYTDAFWQVPLAPEERRFFVGMIKGIILSYLRAAQGSRNGPLSWASVVSLAIRAVQSFFRISCLGRGEYYATKPERQAESGLRCQTYVDDPAMVLRGTLQQRNQSVALTVLLWSSFGFLLAFKKAMRGATVTWIGCEVTVGRTYVVATIKKERIEELLALTLQYLSSNVVSNRI